MGFSRNDCLPLRRNSTIATVADIVDKRAKALRDESQALDEANKSNEAARVFAHWHDMATVAYHLQRLAGKR